MKTNYLAILIAAGGLCCSPINAEPMPSVPDLTNGGSPDATHDWTLGPTGARGWIVSAPSFPTTSGFTAMRHFD
jgi:hypothetical protein